MCAFGGAQVAANGTAGVIRSHHQGDVLLASEKFEQTNFKLEVNHPFLHEKWLWGLIRQPKSWNWSSFRLKDPTLGCTSSSFSRMSSRTSKCKTCPFFRRITSFPSWANAIDAENAMTTPLWAVTSNCTAPSTFLCSCLQLIQLSLQTSRVQKHLIN